MASGSGGLRDHLGEKNRCRFHDGFRAGHLYKNSTRLLIGKDCSQEGVVFQRRGGASGHAALKCACGLHIINAGAAFSDLVLRCGAALELTKPPIHIGLDSPALSRAEVEECDLGFFLIGSRNFQLRLPHGARGNDPFPVVRTGEGERSNSELQRIRSQQDGGG